MRTGAQSPSRQTAVSTAACLQDDRRRLGAWLLLRLGVSKSGLRGARRERPGAATAAAAAATRQESCSRHKFWKVLYIVTFKFLYGKYTRALTFQNMRQGKSRNRSMLPNGADSQASATSLREEMKLDHLSSMLRSGQIHNSWCDTWGHGGVTLDAGC